MIIRAGLLLLLVIDRFLGMNTMANVVGTRRSNSTIFRSTYPIDNSTQAGTPIRLCTSKQSIPRLGDRRLISNLRLAEAHTSGEGYRFSSGGYQCTFLIRSLTLFHCFA